MTKDKATYTIKDFGDEATRKLTGTPVGVITGTGASYTKQYNLISWFSASKVLDGYFPNGRTLTDNTHEYMFVISGGAQDSATSRIPVDVTIYVKNGTDWAYVGHDHVSAINDYLYLGLGNWDALTGTKSIEMSNVDIYKGDKSPIPAFSTIYDNAQNGDTILTVDLSSYAATDFGASNGYMWSDHRATTYPSTQTYADGKITINLPKPADEDIKTTSNGDKHTGQKLGFATHLPLGAGWNTGVYTLEACVTSNKRSVLHIFSGYDRRFGFGLDANTANATTYDFGYDGNFKGGTDSTIKACATPISYAGSTTRKDTSTTGDANVRIVFDYSGEEKLVTLYELSAANDKWIRIAALDVTATFNYIRPIFSVHAYDFNTNVEISGVKLVKGNPIPPYDLDFDTLYADGNWGSTLYELDFSGITDAAKNGFDGYEWANSGVGPTVDDDGKTLLLNAAQGTQGVKTPLALAADWTTGYYTMEFAMNSAERVKIGLFDITATDGTIYDKVGFSIVPNMKYTAAVVDNPDTTDVDETAPESLVWSDTSYLYTNANAINTADIDKNYSASYGNNFNISNWNTAAGATGLSFTLYDTYAEGTDARIVRVQTGSKANVKIEFNGVDKIITLYEKDSNGWQKISSIDWSGAEAAGATITPTFSVHAYNADTNLTLKNVVYKKGFNASHIHTYEAGTVVSDTYATGYDADAAAAFKTAYATKWGLDEANFGFTADGATEVTDFEALYNVLNDEAYAPQAIKLLPFIKLAPVVEGMAIRGVQATAVEANTVDINFVAALASLDGLTSVGFEVTKVTSDGQTVTPTALDDVVATTAYKKLETGNVDLAASAIGGTYVVSAGLSDVTVEAGVQVDYVVKAFTVDRATGTKTYCGEAVTFTFVGGVYTPTATAFVIPQA